MSSEQQKPSGAERLWRFGRDINILGTIAVGSVALLIPGPNAVLASWATFNTLQAGGFELLRRHADKNQANHS